jgi:hypothetical protein
MTVNGYKIWKGSGALNGVALEPMRKVTFVTRNMGVGTNAALPFNKQRFDLLLNAA